MHVFWYIVFQVLTVILKKYMIYTASLPVPLFIVVYIALSVDIYHFYNFLEPDPTFSEKRFLSQIFIF